MESACSRCRPGKPCLSHSWLPFDGTVWLPLEHDLLKKYPHRCLRGPSGRRLRDAAGRYSFSLRGMCFDEIPLGYLDWLAAQDWLRPGPFRTRLFDYLSHPCIQKELDLLFAEPAYGPPTYQRREPMPQEVCEPPTDNWTILTAWEALADFMADADNAFSSETYEVAGFLEAASQVKSALKFLGKLVSPASRDLLRSKYRAWRAACRRTKRHSPDSPYYTAKDRLDDYLDHAYVITAAA